MPESVKGLPDDLQQRIAYVGSPITTQYIGWASPSALTSQAVWKIQRITFDSSGRTTQVEWAGLAATFSTAWDNRALATTIYTPT